MPTIRDRLDACASSAALSTADLAHWFGLSHSTMRAWRCSDREPRRFRLRQIEERLEWLEYAIASDKRLPVPLTVRAIARHDYLDGVRTTAAASS